MPITPFQAYVSQRLGSPVPATAFGEGSPGFTPETDCFVLKEGQYRLSGEYQNSPWCVQKLLESVDDAFQRTNTDVIEAVRKNPSLDTEDRVKAWRKIFDDWKAERNVMSGQLQTARDNSEWREGAPDDEDEDASNQRQRLEQLLDKTAAIREELKSLGLNLRPPAETREEKEKRVGPEPETPAQTTAKITRNIAIAAVAVAGIYGLFQLGFFLPKKKG